MTIEEPNPEITLSSDELAEVALSTIRAVVGTAKYQYLSGPITGGRRFIGWHQSNGRGLSGTERRLARKAAVIDPNIRDVLVAAESERQKDRPTIEPGSFEADFEQWGQPEFYRFWERVIKEHASQIRFMNGWEFSAGCTFEYLCALKHGLRALDIDGQDLTPEAALLLIDGALAEIHSGNDLSASDNKPIADLYQSIRRYRDLIEGKGSSV